MHSIKGKKDNLWTIQLNLIYVDTNRQGPEPKLKKKKNQDTIPVAVCTRCIIMIVAAAAQPVPFTPFCSGKAQKHMYSVSFFMYSAKLVVTCISSTFQDAFIHQW
jgi:hypothetical protein